MRSLRDRILCASIPAALLALAASLQAADTTSTLDFNRDVRPILADKCFVCHGPDAGTRKAKLRLDSLEEATKDRDGTRPIVPGKPDESEAIRRIMSDDEFRRMPPVKSNLSLTDAQKSLLRRWVAEGAAYKPLWSLIPLADKIPAPAVKNTTWPRSELDRFVLARLEAEKLAPAPEASKERWLRRVSFDLTGLPPTQAEIDAFLLDHSTSDYERVVDRLLASPRYGEKMAVQWLDLARYADSFGYQADLDTQGWPYRDWVIRAFNDNLPYDTFITWQLAGDMLPNATHDQKLATAFCRIHRKTQEGGSVEAEYRQEGINDRVGTFGTALLGLTIECARCHDHKYDPITMRDFYSLGAFFNSIDEWGLLHGNSGIQPNPVLYLPTPEQERALAERREAVHKAETAVQALRSARQEAFQQWLAGAHDGEDELPDLAGSYDLEAAPKNKLKNSANPKQPGTLAPADTLVPGKTGKAIQFTGDDAATFTHGGCQQMYDPITVAFWLQPGEDYPRAVVFHNSGGYDPGYNGYELLLEHGQLRWMFAREWPGNCIAIRTREKLAVGRWTHVGVTYDGSGRAAGLRIYLDGKLADTEVIRDHLLKNCGDNGHIDFGERVRDNGLRNGVVDEIRILGRAVTPVEVAQLHDGESLTRLLDKDNRTDAEKAALAEYYFSALDEPMRASVEELHKARTALREVMDNVREIPVMEELPEPRPAFILARGAYDAPHDQPVGRETPAALPPFPSGAPRNRLGLARWLTQPNHPLTGRVAVNHLWQEFFGRGIVVTSENFGLQGQPPSHPELLDWLARDFIDHGWDIKRFCRQLVLSATYRQESRATAALRNRDPENILLARGPAKRLSAEMLRDNALALGGLLVPDIGGPPAKPYQPEGSMWRALNNFLPEYQIDAGPGLYRRSMYTFWRRTTPPPNMLVFDSPTREICAVRRQLTLTPLQPLVLLNDPQFVEAANAFGERMLRLGGPSPVHRAEWAFREVTGRAPTPEESKVLGELYAQQLAYFREGPSRAGKLLKIGRHLPDAALPADELAAAATTASALLNLDATLMLR